MRELRNRSCWSTIRVLTQRFITCQEQEEPVLTVYLISTGGTIEKIYSEPTGTVINLETKIDRYQQRLRLPDCRLENIRLLNKDSLEMTRADRELILQTVREVLPHSSPIIITHGTDTLTETGVFLQSSLPDLQVPVIFTGAMSPLGFEGSDGLQNLTESLLAARILPAGVYLVIHNQVFPIDQVRKNRELARFEWK